MTLKILPIKLIDWKKFVLCQQQKKVSWQKQLKRSSNLGEMFEIEKKPPRNQLLFVFASGQKFRRELSSIYSNKSWSSEFHSKLHPCLPFSLLTLWNLEPEVPWESLSSTFQTRVQSIQETTWESRDEPNEKYRCIPTD